jgi:ABC-2 type transport system permease protein
MRKILVIALRDYNAAVRSKAFLVTLLVLPLLMGGSFIAIPLVKDIKDTKPKRYAVLDRTPGGVMFQALAEKAKKRDEQPEFQLEQVQPTSASPEEQRLELSDRVRQRDYHGFLDIGPAAGGSAADVADRLELRYQSNNPLSRDFPTWAAAVVNEKVQELRTQQKQGWTLAAVKAVVRPVPFKMYELSQRDPSTGKPVPDREVNLLASLLIPVVLVMLMFMMIFVGATPLLQGVVEEKSQRISEVLLGSVQPFSLMLGKLLGTVGVALTLAAVYLGSAFIAAHYAAKDYGFGDLLTPQVLVWFLVFETLGVLMYGSLFVAIGAACSSVQETQTLLMPVMLVAMIPLFVLVPVIQEPDGALATGLSLIPMATPMLMVIRVAIPPGVALWQPVLGVVLVLLTTLLFVWAAGRIFRVGILMQGKGANLAEMMRWVFRG